MPDNTRVITDIQDLAGELREALDDFRIAQQQSDDRDQGNDENVAQAFAALDTFDSAVDAIVP